MDENEVVSYEYESEFQSLLDSIESLDARQTVILGNVESLSADVQALAASINASTYSGTFNATALGWFDRCADKIPLTDDYVAFRDSQYGYTLVWGDFSIAGSRFSGDIADGVRITVPHGNTQLDYQYASVSSGLLSLSVGTDIVYSNLGSYPVLDRSTSPALALILILLIVSMMGKLIWEWFKFTLRGGDQHGSASGGSSYRSYD